MDAYCCPAGEKLTHHYTNEEAVQQLRGYWTNACRDCALKLTAQPARNDELRVGSMSTCWRRRRDVSTTMLMPCGSGGRWSNIRSGACGRRVFLTKTLPKVTAEMALSVLAYDLTRAMNIVEIKPLIAAVVA
jgi:hypothetical protein